MSPLRSLLSRYTRRLPGHKATRTNRRRLTLELLEDRTVPTAVAPPSGLVSWWTADNTAADLIGPNHGTLNNGAGFMPGYVAGSFNSDGIDDYVQAPTS